MTMRSFKIVILALVFVFGGIVLADKLGYWQTESSKSPAKFTSGEFEGLSNPEDIRGSYSFKDIENAFGVEASLIAKAFGIISDNPDLVKAKDLETIYVDLGDDIEIGTGSVKLFVSIYTGLPYEGEDYLPSIAMEVLKEEGKWTEELDKKLADFIIPVDNAVAIENIIVSEDHDEEIVSEEMSVKGKSTVAEIISYGVDQKYIEELLGSEIKNINVNLRDLCEQQGVSFSEVKEKLNEKINEK